MPPRADASSGKWSRWTGRGARRWCWDKCDKEWTMAEERKDQSVHDVEHEDKEEAAREGHGAIFATLKAEDKKRKKRRKRSSQAGRPMNEALGVKIKRWTATFILKKSAKRPKSNISITTRACSSATATCRGGCREWRSR